MNNDAPGSEMAELRDTVHAGFARMDRYFERTDRYFERTDRYFELMQAQHLELRDLLVALTTRVDRIEARLSGLTNQVREFRDWVSRELADVRRELRLLRQATEPPNAELRRDIDALDARVTRLEQRRDDTRA